MNKKYLVFLGLFLLTMGGIASAITQTDGTLSGYNNMVSPTGGDISPTTASEWNDIGDTYYDGGKYDDALAAYSSATELDPQNTKSWHQKGLSLFMLDRNNEAIEAFDKVLAIDPDSVETMNAKGATLINLKQYDQAIELFKKCTELNSSNSKAWGNWGNALYKQEDYSGALPYLLKSIDIDPKNLNFLFKAGNALSILGKAQESNKKIQQFIALKPDDPKSYLVMSINYNSLGDYQNSLEAAEKMITLAPQDGQGYAWKGNALKGLKKNDEALLALDESLKLDPSSSSASYVWISKGDILISQSKFKDAVDAFQKAVNIVPNNQNALNKLKIAQEKSNETPLISPPLPSPTITTAIPQTEDSFKGLSADGYNTQGNAFFDKEKYDDARKAYLSAIALDPSIPTYYGNLGSTLDKLGNLEEALVQFDKHIELGPDDWVWDKKAQTLASMGRYNEALSAEEQAITLNPDNPLYSGNMGDDYLHLNRYQEALELFNMQISKQPTAWVWNEKGLALLGLGKNDEATTAFQKALEIEPGNTFANRQLQNLTSK